ncbi:two-component sensor histidine kinase [Kitasatospora herbaricolor]|uniref:sensor histidine kinase n=1 Tax=Kitasatospora herbaricolor TaxID=68217 RepID=UPI00174DF7FE|nr:histidine kinase [Kitasatospora herbaricolor]MDQ0310911.1 signal transduction histidine kinase [Kitasatospora herbaricolor]GGV27990.1 two-component sensor histidine kinase [Kitasatospora herbaricolor]
MPPQTWTRWPAREGPAGEPSTPARRALSLIGRGVLVGVLVWGTFAPGDQHGWGVAVAALGLVAALAQAAAFLRAGRERWLRSSLTLAATLLATAWAADLGQAHLLANFLRCGLGLTALIRLPLVAALPVAALSLGSYALASGDGWPAVSATVGGLALFGYLLRLDGEARGAAVRLLRQERAARAAEAESAALAERARIAREIHDVLAHSLSAQLVHLEAARLMLDAGADRARVRERVVAARRMARDGLTETRQALSALRGEFTPVGEYLVGLAEGERAGLTVTGTPRPLAAEAGLAVRRTAQEALTNVRKHAAGARCTLELRYLEGVVELEVRNAAARAARAEQRAGQAPGAAPGAGAEEGAGARVEPVAGLAESGSGYGLLGMRERAELLGGTLLAGPDEGGWRVLLRTPG